MLLDARTYTLLLTLSVCTPFVASQVVSGCPSYGCTPTGSFALLTSAGIPRSGVSVIWTTQISNSSGTGSPLLGCVSNNKHIVCPTPEGYVGLNSTTGSVIWRDNNLANPMLPIMDVTGDVIGTNGTFLMKIDSNGTTEQPVIPLVPPMHPVYSVVFGEGNIALLVSQTGELVAYLTNGTPLASLFLTGTVERYNGTFHPIAQPVMNGSRAYILTQFKPDPQYTQIPRDKLATLGLQRLYAVDVSHSMNIAWWVNLELEVYVRCRSQKHENQGDGVKPGPPRKGDGDARNGKDAEVRRVSRHPGLHKTSKAEMSGDERLIFSKEKQEQSEVRLVESIMQTDSNGFVSQESESGTESSKTNANLKYRYLEKNKPGMDLVTSKKIVQMKQDTNKDNLNIRLEVLPGSSFQISDSQPNASVVYFFGAVLVSVSPPEGLCDGIQSEIIRQCCLGTTVPTLWGVQDNGDNMTVTFTEDHPLCYVSVYDSFYTSPGTRGNKNMTKKTETHRLREGRLVWAVPQFGNVINGFDQISGQFQQIVNLTLMLNTSVQITSRVMVGVDNGTNVNVLVFAIRRLNKTQTFKMADRFPTANNNTNYLVAVDTSYGDAQVNVMWVLPVPNDFEVQGQISLVEVTGSPNASFVVTAQGPNSQIAFAFNLTHTH